MSINLKRCPFCGGNANCRPVTQDGKNWVAHCNNGNCFVRVETPKYPSRDSAVTRWNTRHEAAKASEQPEEKAQELMLSGAFFHGSPGKPETGFPKMFYEQPVDYTALEQNLESMRQTNAALVKKLQERESSAWQPIDTAPKDKDIWACWTFDGTTIFQGVIAWAFCGYAQREMWCSGYGGEMDGMNAVPTHWQPLTNPTNIEVGSKE